MKQLYYAFKYLLNSKGSNLIKIISLTLGFSVGLLLLGRVAFEMSFDNFYEDVDRLYYIDRHTIINGDDRGNSRFIFAPVAEAVRNEIPEVENATILRRQGYVPLFHNDMKYMPNTLYADSLFFRTMGIEVIQGDEAKLGIPDQLFLSDEYARRVFKEEDPIGKQLLYKKKYAYTVAGVFKNIPENSEMPFDAVASFVNMSTQFGWSVAWGKEDSYYGYVRFKPGADITQAEQKLQTVISKYMPVEEMEQQGLVETFTFQHITNNYAKHPEIRRMILVMSALALAILFVMAMNYILISVSSLVSRAKMVGIHKCSGASGKNIFTMFMYETITIVACSLFCMLLLILAFRSQIEAMADASLSALFSWGNLWLPLSVLICVCLLVVIVPGRIFSAIPVSQIFQGYSAGKRGWKRILLFVQFGGIAFVFSLLAVILLQYQHIIKRDIGYNPEGVVYATLSRVDTKEKLSSLTTEFSRLPYVKAVANSRSNLINGYGGMPIQDNDDNWLFTTRYTMYDNAYADMLGLKFVAGHNIEHDGDLLVNESFVKRMGWKDGAIGKTVRGNNQQLGTIVGVMKDYTINASIYVETDIPVLIQGETFIPNGIFTLRLTELTSDRLDELNSKIAGLYPQEDITFSVLTERLHAYTSSIRLFRDAVSLATIVIFIIALMGLFGYVEDEVNRRSKEIAIRKINGATASCILGLLSKDITYTALPAIIFGVSGSYLLGSIWLQQFPNKTTLNALIFIFTGLLLLGIIILCVTLRSWHIANENPAESIKSE